LGLEKKKLKKCKNCRLLCLCSALEDAGLIFKNNVIQNLINVDQFCHVGDNNKIIDISSFVRKNRFRAAVRGIKVSILYV